LLPAGFAAPMLTLWLQRYMDAEDER